MTGKQLAWSLLGILGLFWVGAMAVTTQVAQSGSNTFYQTGDTFRGYLVCYSRQNINQVWQSLKTQKTDVPIGCSRIYGAPMRVGIVLAEGEDFQGDDMSLVQLANFETGELRNPGVPGKETAYSIAWHDAALQRKGGEGDVI